MKHFTNTTFFRANSRDRDNEQIKNENSSELGNSKTLTTNIRKVRKDVMKDSNVDEPKTKEQNQDLHSKPRMECRLIFDIGSSSTKIVIMPMIAVEQIMSTSAC